MSKLTHIVDAAGTSTARCTAALVAVFVLVAATGCDREAPAPSLSAPAPTQADQIGTAAVAIPDSYGAQIAEDVLREGGSAVDAAVAVGFSMAVTFIDAGNIGGGGFMLAQVDGEAAFLDYRETAPLAAHRDMYLDENGEVIENASLIGAQAAGVPGTVAGLWAAHQRFGKLPWRRLVMPAVALAEDGFLPAEILVYDIHAKRDWFGDSTNFFDYFGSIETGQTFRQPELAETLRRIAELGQDDFYRGETANMIAEQVARSGGLITLEDLEGYEAVWREPLSAEWRDYKILSAPPPSSGGFAVIQLLKMKDKLAHLFEGVDHNSPQYIHLVAEMEKRVFADRAEYLGDPDFTDTQIERLIDDDYIAARALEVNADAITPESGVEPGLESMNTTHYSIVDRWGNAVSNTYTINYNYGSGVVVEGAGFLLNNEMDDFSVKPGVPNVFGVVGGTANEIEPGKRMLSSMSPTLLTRDGEVAMVVGTPGGSTIFTSVFQTIVNVIDFEMTPYDAVAATRFHHQLLPADLITYSVTRPLPDDVITQLGDRGYRAEPHFIEFGDVQIIWRDGEGWQPASDPRDRGDSRIISPAE